MDNQELEIIIQKLALQNAYKYGKVPQVGAVTGKTTGHTPGIKAPGQGAHADRQESPRRDRANVAGRGQDEASVDRT